jgi:hypothetical protein
VAGANDQTKEVPMTRWAIVLGVLALASGPAYACIEPPAVTHDRELTLLDTGIQKFKVTPVSLAKAKALRDQSEQQYRAGEIDSAAEMRHQALSEIGYRFESPAAGDGVPTIGLEPPPKEPSRGAGVAEPPVNARCGGFGTWLAPTQ